MIKSLAFLGLPDHEITSNGDIWVKERVINCNGTKRVYKAKKATVNIGNNGYIMCTVRYNGKVKGFSLHRTLGILFIPNPENLPIVHHKDGNKQNNRISNLEWSTSVRNVRHALNTGLTSRKKGINHPKTKLNPEKAKEILELVALGNMSYNNIGQIFGVSGSTVKDVMNGKIWGNNRKYTLTELEEYINSNNIVYAIDLINTLKKVYG